MHNPSAWAGIVSLAFAILLQTAVLAFWLGRLSQRVQTLEEGAKGDSGMLEKVIRLEEKMAHVEQAINRQGAALEGINRQLGNIAMGRIGLAGEIK